MQFPVIKTLVFLLLNIYMAGAFSQTTIKGIIRDNKSNPLPGVSISLKDSYDGSTSDSTGKYSFKTFEKGTQVLVFSSIGYVPVEHKISISGNILTIDINMKEEISELRAVVLSAGTF
jgi:hypothetical protein